ncbi:MAG TPA: hypothetical protein VFN75_06800, partial [Pseudonocardiaceae bacterium]|nr:hypothetical protein [Pseudonocardiaceae bacterium]
MTLRSLPRGFERQIRLARGKRAIRRSYHQARRAYRLHERERGLALRGGSEVDVDVQPLHLDVTQAPVDP